MLSLRLFPPVASTRTSEISVLPFVREEGRCSFLLGTGRKAAVLLAAGVILGAPTAVQPALATGALWCEAEDQVLTFRARSGVSRGINGGFLKFTADLQVKLGDVPADFRQLQFDESSLSHRWLDRKQLKLRLHRERAAGPAGYLVFVVETDAVEEGQYRGGYELTVFDTANDGRGRSWEVRGAVSCSAE
jgi:hypothetical protein